MTEDEIRRDERKKVGWELEELRLAVPAQDGCCIVNSNEHAWWKYIMTLRHSWYPSEYPEGPPKAEPRE